MRYAKDKGLKRRARRIAKTGIQMMARDGLKLPRPGKLSDEALHERLWVLIGYMASHSVFMTHTDHLNDRQLYTILIRIFTRDAIEDFGTGDGFHILDLIGTGSDKDIELYLRHYADREDRCMWDDPLPPMEPPPYDRDRHLPRGPFGDFVEYDSRKAL